MAKWRETELVGEPAKKNAIERWHWFSIGQQCCLIRFYAVGFCIRARAAVADGFQFLVTKRIAECQPDISCFIRLPESHIDILVFDASATSL
jgi:hypothetical protein